MSHSASHHADLAPGPRVVIVVDDPSERPAELASLVRHLRGFVGPSGPPSIEVVAARPRPTPGSRFIERRERTTDRRQVAHLPTAADAASAIADAPRAVPGSPGANAWRPCTDREREIVQLLRRGLTNKQIAQQLGIVEQTVKKHLQHIYNKLGVHRRALVMLGHVGTRVHGDGHPALAIADTGAIPPLGNRVNHHGTTV